MTKTYAITEIQLVRARHAIQSRSDSDFPEIVAMLQALPLITGEPVAWMKKKTNSIRYHFFDAAEILSAHATDWTPLYTHPQPPQPQSFDEWQRSPHMTRFQRFIDEDYVLKLQPITADDVTDEMWAAVPANLDSTKQDIVDIYNSVIKHKGDTQ